MANPKLNIELDIFFTSSLYPLSICNSIFIFPFSKFYNVICKIVLELHSQVENTMRPEMLYTINEYDPNKPDHPMTKAWDDTQSKVITIQ